MKPGDMVGPYRVVDELGVGGMGEVYRARDTKLHRDVAIKLLPELFAADAERIARFEREAQLLAALNHPCIAHIHGLEESSGVRALVIELVEGQTLADRIAQGPIPPAEAVPIARQIAEALEAAHDQGIIHRDLKPANVKVREDGTVKVLDFGLAKALDPMAGSSAAAMNSPTLSIRATQAGIILGTASYMSPEQARGRPVDRRSDIWSFGVVLYEMLTGGALFSGETITDILAAVVTRDPDLRGLPPGTPSHVRDLLRRCLVRDPKQRLQAIGEARIAFEAALNEPPAGAVPPAGAGVTPAWRRAVPWTVAVAALAVAGVVLMTWAPWRSVPPARPLRVSAELGADVSLVLTTQAPPGGAVALSPDGALLVFVAQKNTAGTSQLYLRRLDQLQAAPLSGTEGAMHPFFSPDAQWVGFFADRKLKKVPVTGGAAVTLADAPDARGGAWTEDDSILFSPNRIGVGLLRVSSAGGTAEPLTSLDRGEMTHRWPQVLPGGRVVLYTASSSAGGDFDNANLVMRPLAGGSSKVVVRGGHYGRYFASGHLVYVHQGTLFAAPFDVGRLQLTGPAVPVLEGIAANTGTGGAHFAASGNGTMVYASGQSLSTAAPIHWMDRQGRTTPLRTTPAIWNGLRLSPDGRRAAMLIRAGGEADIWVYEWERDALTRLTSDPAEDTRPVWTRDGSRIVFSSTRSANVSNLFWQRSDRPGDAERLTESTSPQFPGSWHPSGKLLAFVENSTSPDLMILPMDGSEATGWKPGKPTVFLNSKFAEMEPAFSHDGRWIAYQANDTGPFEVYVRPFLGPGGMWRISTTGGTTPVWSRSRQELFYSTPDQHIMVVPYAADGQVFRAEKPRLWSEARHIVRPGGRAFDLHPDGDRIALAAAPAVETGAREDRVVFIFNFFDELRRLAPRR